MFSKQFRLPAHVSFTNCIVKSNQFFTSKSTKNGLSYNRYGFVVSKKVSLLATQRNFLRRRFRAVLEKMNPTLAQGYDFLFILKKEAREANTEMLAKEVEKTGILNQK